MSRGIQDLSNRFHRHIKGLMLIGIISLAGLYQSPLYATYECTYDEVTVSPTDSYLTCVTTCPTQLHWIPPNNMLSCNFLHQQNWCRRYCADAEADVCEGNPIKLSSGAKLQSETDYQELGEFPLTLRRHYSTAWTMPDGRWGENWLGTDSSRLISVNTDNEGDTYTVVRPNGAYLKFTWVSAGTTRPLKTDTQETLTLYNYNGGHIWVLRLTDGTHEVFDFDLQAFADNQRYASKLLWRKWRGGLRHTYAYDSEDRLETITHSNGQQLQFFYDADDRIEQVTAPGGQTYSYVYDLAGNLASVTYPGAASDDANDTATKTYLYEDSRHPHHLTGILDENGQRFATYAYDSEGRTTLSEHGDGGERLEVLQYGANVRTRNALGKETVYRFGTSGSGVGTLRQLLSVEGEASASCAASNSSYSYDSNGFKDLIKDENDHYTDLDYDDRGQLTRRTEGLVMVDGNLEPLPEARVVETDWLGSPALNLPQERRVPGKTTHYSYQNDRLISRTETDTTEHTTPYSTNGNSRTWTYGYTFHDADQRQVETITIDGPIPGNLDTTQYTLDALGNLTRLTNALGHVTNYSNHTPQGRPGRVTDANGLITEMSYNALGLLTETRTLSVQGTATTRYAYHPNRLISRVTLPDSSYLGFEYNAARHLTAIVNNQEERIEYTPSPLDGEWTEEIVRSGDGSITRTKQRVFDELGRVIRLLGANTQQTDYRYDLAGNRVAQTEQGDTAEAETLQSHDGLNRLATLTDPLQHLVQFGYDNQGNINAVTDQLDNTTRYVYDGFSNLIQQTSPDTGITTYTYDEAGNRLSKTDARGVTTTYTYDALSRVTGIQYPDSTLNRVYHYDQGVNGLGRLTQMNDAEGVTDYAYNDNGALVEQTRTSQDGVVTTFAYAYDAQGRLASQTYPSGHSLWFSYSQGLLSGLTLEKPDGTTQPLATNLSYLPFGPHQSLDYGNGLNLNRTFDQDYRLTDQQITGLLESRYSYDPMDNITDWEDLLDSNEDRQFRYDLLNRLTQVDRSEYSGTGYTYDAVGNRLSTSSWSMNGIMSGTTTLPVYDEVGNALQNTSGNYRYDDTNRMVGFISADTNTQAEYAYNGKGERIRKSVNSVITRFRYGPGGQLLGEYNQSGQPIREYVYLDGQPIALLHIPEDEPSVHFDQTPILSYAGADQDVAATVNILGDSLTISGNGWKKIAFPYTITPDTILEFDFQGFAEGEIQGIGFDTDNAISAEQSFKLYGSEYWGIQDFTPYSGRGVRHYYIPVGEYFTGEMQWMTFINDHDVGNPTARSRFSNIRVYESGEVSTEPMSLAYLHTDHLGAVVKATDENQAIIWEARRKPFGYRVISTEQVDMPLGFPGQYFDEESRNYYNYFRDYDPTTGRYLQSDPIGLVGGINTYTYVESNPLSLIDPLGLASYGGLITITRALERLARAQGDDFHTSKYYGPERDMLKRLWQGKSDPEDVAFWHHELAEAQQCEKYFDLSDEDYLERQREAHEDVLEHQDNSPDDLYHPSVKSKWEGYFK